jgi:hypothetical protein
MDELCDASLVGAKDGGIEAEFHVAASLVSRETAKARATARGRGASHGSS